MRGHDRHHLRIRLRRSRNRLDNLIQHCSDSPVTGWHSGEQLSPGPRALISGPRIVCAIAYTLHNKFRVRRGPPPNMAVVFQLLHPLDLRARVDVRTRNRNVSPSTVCR